MSRLPSLLPTLGKGLVAVAMFSLTIPSLASGVEIPSQLLSESSVGVDPYYASAPTGNPGGSYQTGSILGGNNSRSDCCADCCQEGCCDCPPIGDVMFESIFGHPDPDCWTPLTLSTLFSEGWRESWVPSPNGSGGAPRQGWINAADGNMYRLSFFTFAQGFDQRQGYYGAYTLYTPFSRRLLLITNVPFIMRDNVVTGQPIVGGNPQTTPQDQTAFGDVSFTPRVLLHETQDFSLTAELAVLTPTGAQPIAGKAALTPQVAFWYNLAGGWVIRGGLGDYIPTQESGGSSTLISQLAIGQTVTDHDVPLFGDFTYYLSMVGNTPLSSGSQTSVTATLGLRTHLGNDWYFLAALPTPVTSQRVANLNTVFWFMKAW